MTLSLFFFFFFFFNDTATTEIYTLSLHDALPIYSAFSRTLSIIFRILPGLAGYLSDNCRTKSFCFFVRELYRSEEHTSELQSQSNHVCRLLLEKKKKIIHSYTDYMMSVKISTLLV